MLIARDRKPARRSSPLKINAVVLRSAFAPKRCRTEERVRAMGEVSPSSEE